MRHRRRVRRILIVAGVILLIPAIAVLSLRWINPVSSAYMLRIHWDVWRAGVQGDAIHQHWVDIDDMASCMPLAVVAAEDQTFPYHNGFAWAALRGAMADNFAGTSDGVRGASTISQQTAKNLFLWPGGGYARKAVEGYITIWLELLMSKRRILELYLNIAQFGDRVFGVGAAAKRLFGRSAAGLTTYQCAALAAVLPAPDQFNAAAPSAYVSQRIRWIRTQMRNLGRNYLTSIGLSWGS